MPRRLAIACAFAFLAAGLPGSSPTVRGEGEAPRPATQPTKPAIPPRAATPAEERRRLLQEQMRERAAEREARRHPAAATVPATQPGIPVGPLRLLKVVAPPDPNDVTDEQIGAAIEHGADYLMSLFQNGELTVPNNMPNAPRMGGNLTGPDVLAVYALMQCGLATKIEKLDIKNAYLQALIEKMKAMPVEERVATYTHGLRSTALSVYNRPEDRATLEADLEWLLRATDGGHYTYVMPPARAKLPLGVNYNPGSGTTGFDNSNSQYGLLGVWSAAEAGAEIPGAYWSAVERHWSGTQLFDGMWPIVRIGMGQLRGTFTMTLAGVASLFVTQDYLYGQNLSVGREPFTPPLLRGLTWLEAGNNCQFVAGYGGYALERVGLASGFKYFGVRDWYREGARRLIQTQQPDGSWGREGPTGPINTAYNLLFLARGRHPILYNKLRFDHFWANRPRDVANLAKFANRELEHSFNWQVVSIDHDWTDWLESPVLYLASHEAAKLKDADYEKIRNFINAGGLLFTQADAGSAAFNKYAEVLASKVCPNYELGKIPPDHEIYKVLYKLDPKKLQLKGVTNGSRLLMVHSPTDVSQCWQLQASKSHVAEYQFGLNLFVYAAGKSDFSNRIAGTYIPPVPPRSVPLKPGGLVKVSRIKYGGNWDPEPGAWQRFARWFQWQTSCVVDVEPVDAEKLALSPDKNVVQLAHLTGTVAFNLSDAQAKALRAFVEGGGVLFVDACGSATVFNDALAGKFFPQVFPASQLNVIRDGHPIFGTLLPGSEDVHKPVLRPYALAKLGNASSVARIEGFAFGKGHVFYSWMDVASGFLGNKTFGVIGYEPNYAVGLMNNLVLWTAAGQPETIAPPATLPSTRPATMPASAPVMNVPPITPKEMGTDK